MHQFLDIVGRSKFPLPLFSFGSYSECASSSLWPWHEQRKTRSQAEAKCRHSVGICCLALCPRKSNGVDLRHKQARGWMYRHERWSTSFSFHLSNTALVFQLTTKFLALTLFLRVPLQITSLSNLLHLLFISVTFTLTSSYCFDFISPFLILLWLESQGRWSMRADAPHPVSEKQKTKADPRKTNSAGGHPGEKFIRKP